jgi:hypothetical protein
MVDMNEYKVVQGRWREERGSARSACTVTPVHSRGSWIMGLGSLFMVPVL